MIVFKKRTDPIELEVLQALNWRSALDPTLKKNFLNVHRGYQGEKHFDNKTEKLATDGYQLNDLLLKYNDTTFQIDSLIITEEKIYVYEIKNYHGEYVYEADRFYKHPKKEIVHPVHQLSRMTSLLNQLFRKYGFTFPIQSYLVFINPEFTLFQAPFNSQIILPTQVETHLKMVNDSPSRLTGNHKRLAEKLSELHMDQSPYMINPAYSYDELLKGIPCTGCGQFYLPRRRSVFFKCNSCSILEKKEVAILRTVQEFKRLFPEKKITTSQLHDWCGQIISEQTIRNVLDHYFEKRGYYKGRYYE